MTDCNRINHECPVCKNPTIFNIDGKYYFCAKCLKDFDPQMVEIPNNINATENEIAETDLGAEIPEKPKAENPDILIDPSVMVPTT
jgi:uncharacterized Zn finger protein (UPF0148 family)